MPINPLDLPHLFCGADAAPGETIGLLYATGGSTDDGRAIEAKARTARTAIGGPPGIAQHGLWAKLWVVLSWRTAANVTVTPIVDDRQLEPQVIGLPAVAVGERRTQKFPLGLSVPVVQAGVEVYRLGARGTWLQVDLAVTCDPTAGTVDVVLDGVLAEAEPCEDATPVWRGVGLTFGTSGGSGEGGGGGGTSATAVRLTASSLPSLLDGGYHLPDHAAYEALGVPALTVGQSYLDPASGQRVFKLYADGMTDYPNGGPRISQPLDGAGTRLVLHNRRSDRQFVVTRATPSGDGLTLTGVTSTVLGTQPFDEICCAFSQNPLTPSIAYVLRWNNGAGQALLSRWDFATFTEAPATGFPAGGRLFAWSTTTGVEWLTMSADESIFAFQQSNNALVQFYVPATNTATTYTPPSGYDEGKLTPDGAFFAMYVSNHVEYHPIGGGSHLIAGTTGVGHPNAGHAAPTDGGYWPSEDDDETGYWVPSTNTMVATAQDPNTPGFTRADYRSVGWRQPTVPLSQRYWLAITDDPQAEGFTVGSWVAQGSGVYKAPITAFGAYVNHANRPAVGFLSANAGVTSGAASGRDRVIATLTPVSASGSVVAGTCYTDYAGAFLWVKLPDGSDPTGRVTFTWAHGGGLHLGFYAMPGNDKRLLCHTYNRMPNGGSDGDVYYWRPRASQSADGRVVVFSSTMGRFGGRQDVFVTFPPVTVVP